MSDTRLRELERRASTEGHIAREQLERARQRAGKEKLLPACTLFVRSVGRQGYVFKESPLGTDYGVPVLYRIDQRHGDGPWLWWEPFDKWLRKKFLVVSTISTLHKLTARLRTKVKAGHSSC